MNRYLELGRINRLRITRLTDFGPVLASTEGKEVLLPKRYADESLKIGDVLEVFVYTDSEDRFVATTERPAAMLGEATHMEVVGLTPYGAFVDWGLSKDLFVPKQLQKTALKIGDRPLIFVDYDERTHRLIGTAQWDKKLSAAKKSDLNRNQAVSITLYERSPMGYKAVVQKRFAGLIPHKELFKEVQPGDTLTAYVKQVRSDGKVDLLSRPIGKAADTLAADKVMAHLRSRKGMLPLNYKSDPENVKALLGLSRKNFKRALTYLIDKGLIDVKEDGTYLKRRC